MQTTYGYFEPLIGIAFQPRSLPNTSFRAGFDSSQLLFLTQPINYTADIAPFSPTYTSYAGSCGTISFDDPYASPCTFNGAAPFPPFASVNQAPPSTSTFNTPVTIPATFSPDFKLGITQSWNASVEQQFPGSLALHLAYVSSESYHQTTVIDQNPGVYALDGNSALNTFGQILTDSSARHRKLSQPAGWVGEEAFARHPIPIELHLVAHDRSHLLGQYLVRQPNSSEPLQYPLQPWKFASQYSVISTTNFVYTTTELRGSHGLIRSALGSWELSAIFTLQSGFPFPVAAGGSNNNSGAQQYRDRADIVPVVPVRAHHRGKSQWINQYFNPAAFTANAPGAFGNSQKNALRGPVTNTADAAIIKNWQVHERYGLQFRFELFNAFNHPSFGNPNTSLTAGNVGAITSVGSVLPRVGQVALKLSF